MTNSLSSFCVTLVDLQTFSGGKYEARRQQLSSDSKFSSRVAEQNSLKKFDASGNL